MGRLLEAEMVRQGLPVSESCTIRRVSVLQPYLAYYARELAAYAELVADPSALGFFVPDRPSVPLDGRGWERASSLHVFRSVLTSAYR